MAAVLLPCRLDVILRRPDPSFDDIFWECVRYVRKGFESNEATFSQDDQAQLKQAIRGATEPNNHVLQLFMKRCFQVRGVNLLTSVEDSGITAFAHCVEWFQLLVRALLGEPTTQQLRQLSLTHAVDTVQEMTQQAVLLFQH